MTTTAPERLRLTAGPLTLEFDPADGWVRYVRHGGHEVLRAVYPAVRDRYWNTLPNRLSNLVVAERDGGFTLTFDADCRDGAIDFGFRGEVTGTADGAVTYRFIGVARSTFLRNRIGLCVLHPDTCAGRPCVIGHRKGEAEESWFPLNIAPHQPFFDVESMAHEFAPGKSITVTFAGDVFETEDQRNWTDASFKTYSTPLAVPFPVEVAAGEAVRQEVKLVIGSGLTATSSIPAAPVEVPARIDRLPRLGFGIGGPLSSRELELLRPLQPDHLRVEVTPADAGTADRLRAAAATATALGTTLEIALLLGDDPAAELARLAAVVRDVRPPVGAWHVLRGQSGVAGADELGPARQHLGPLTPTARFGVGTNGYFTQLNRTRVPSGDADFVVFSLNPQVHAFDDESVVETLDGQSAVVANARRLAPGRRVVVSPVTLCPRYNPTGGDAFGPDPRQQTLFGAAWTVGSIRRMAAAGAAGMTYFEPTGPDGLMDDRGVFPVYHVFAALAGVAGWELDTGVFDRPREVEGMLFRSGGRWRALVANLTARPREVRLQEPGCRARMLGEATPEAVAGDRLTLGPYAVARLEGSAG